ncbi:hypothetical protein F2P79_004777 [Pimephales promelas]|nr:hypothetical protein F2P79_004777 [Pimephales promelas]
MGQLELEIEKFYYRIEKRKRGNNFQELTKIEQLKTGKVLPGLMSLDFYIHETQSSKASVSVQFTKSVEINPIPVEISLQVGRKLPFGYEF